MPKGVQNTKQAVESLAELVADIVAIIQGGLSMNSVPKVFEALNDIRQIIESAPAAFPELIDLDAQEAGELGAVAYASIYKVVDQIRSLVKK